MFVTTERSHSKLPQRILLHLDLLIQAKIIANRPPADNRILLMNTPKLDSLSLSYIFT